MPVHEVLDDGQVLGTPPLDGKRQRGMAEAITLLDVTPRLKGGGRFCYREVHSSGEKVA